MTAAGAPTQSKKQCWVRAKSLAKDSDPQRVGDVPDILRGSAGHAESPKIAIGAGFRSSATAGTFSEGPRVFSGGGKERGPGGAEFRVSETWDEAAKVKEPWSQGEDASSRR